MEKREAIDYPNYVIYSDGRIWSKKRPRCAGNFLIPVINNRGYYYISLYKNSKPKKFTVHRLIARHFLDDWDENLEVDHIDRNKLNNTIENLRMVNRSQNLQNRDSKNVYKWKNYWVYSKVIRGKKTCKYFKTEKEAYDYKSSL